MYVEVLGQNALLMREVREEQADWFEQEVYSNSLNLMAQHHTGF